MSGIVTDLRDIGLCEQDAYFMGQQLTTMRSYNKARESARERAAAQEAEKQRLFHRGNSFMKPVLTVDQQQYEELCSKYGYEAFSDREFIRDMQRLCPETAICKA